MRNSRRQRWWQPWRPWRPWRPSSNDLRPGKHSLKEAGTSGGLGEWGTGCNAPYARLTHLSMMGGRWPDSARQWRRRGQPRAFPFQWVVFHRPQEHLDLAAWLEGHSPDRQGNYLTIPFYKVEMALEDVGADDGDVPERSVDDVSHQLPYDLARRSSIGIQVSWGALVLTFQFLQTSYGMVIVR